VPPPPKVINISGTEKSLHSKKTIRHEIIIDTSVILFEYLKNEKATKEGNKNNRKGVNSTLVINLSTSITHNEINEYIKGTL